MHAMIRRDVGAAADAETLRRTGRALTTEMSRIPGFVSHVAFTTGDGTLVSISICEDVAGLDAAGELLTAWLSLHMPGTLPPPDVVTGEIVMQRGL